NLCRGLNMSNLSTDDVLLNPYPIYDQMRSNSPVLHLPSLNLWMIFDYEGVKRALNDHETFSSRVPAPRHWFIFFDPPQHTKLRALISRAFTPRVVANLEPRIRQLSRELLDSAIQRGEMDLAADYSVPLPMMVIAQMIGIPVADWPRFRRWSDGMLKLTYGLAGGQEAAEGSDQFSAVTLEMNAYLTEMIAQRQGAPKDDLLTLLVPRLGSANRDPQQFPGADRFDITRAPNPHLAFGHGIHSCLGAPLSRMEARIALSDLLERLKGLKRASEEPWEPRRALHVH